MKNPLVVGYKGEIGSFILNGLLRITPKANDIMCVDINNSVQEIIDRIDMSDVIFLCVPIEKTVEWLEQYYHVIHDKMIFEQTSIKGTIFDSYIVKKLNIIPMHIMFRPSGTPDTIHRKVALFNTPEHRLNLDMMEIIKEITESQIVFFNSIETHDKKMAIQQALTHRVLLVLDYMIKSNGHATYVGDRVAELADRINGGDEVLYETIQNNQYTMDGVQEMVDKLLGFELNNYWRGKT